MRSRSARKGNLPAKAVLDELETLMNGSHPRLQTEVSKVLTCHEVQVSCKALGRALSLVCRRSGDENAWAVPPGVFPPCL